MHRVPHVLRGLPRDQYQRGRGLADLPASAGNRRALYLSEMHRLSHVLPGGRLHRRNRHRPLAGPAAAGSVDGESKMAADAMNAVPAVEERSLTSFEMTENTYDIKRHHCHFERSEKSFFKRLERLEPMKSLERGFHATHPQGLFRQVGLPHRLHRTRRRISPAPDRALPAALG